MRDMYRLLTALGPLAIISIVACSGGPGQASNLRGGPDGIPGSSTDNPGTGNESPGKNGQDPAGASTQDPSTTCIDCSGTYQCTTTGQSNASIITLTPVAGGCAIVSDNATDSSLLCGGQFVSTSGGANVTVGQWSGGTDRFSVTVSINGQTLTASCQLTTSTPTQIGGTTPTNVVDAG